MIITESKQRISDFQSHVNSRVREIRAAGDQSWQRVTASGEVEIVRDFLVGKGRGTDYLNRSLTSLLGTNGRVVKFASIFLHQMPMVFGLRSLPSGQPAKLDKRCELGDLQTLFLYLDRDKSICQARSVIFQAKLKPHTGSHVIDHPQQRELYDECEAFSYDTVLKGQNRRLPSGHLRERALQYIFVDERPGPVRVRTIPSNAGQGAFENYGEHLLRFLNDSTGLDVPPNKLTDDPWGQVVWDMIGNVSKEVTSRGLVRNSGLDGLLDHFNHFENHEVFSIDATGGRRLQKGEEGFGLQLVIVWDSNLGGEQRAGITVKPKIGVEQNVQPINPNVKHDLQFTNVDNMLADLEFSEAQQQHEIVLELDSRIRCNKLSDQEAQKTLKVLNSICHSLAPETAQIAYNFQQKLKSRVTVKQMLYVSH